MTTEDARIAVPMCNRMATEHAPRRKVALRALESKVEERLCTG
jgi:hypothetical protein